MKEPFLPSYAPSPLHVIDLKGASNYQNEFFDKSPMKKKRQSSKKVTCEEVIQCRKNLNKKVKLEHEEKRVKQKKSQSQKR